MPPLNDTPGGRAYGPGFSPILALLTSTYNNELRAGLKTISTNNPEVTININDFYGLLVYATSPEGQAASGYKDVSDACYNSTSGSVCAEPNTYIYWDTVHPTTIGHSYIAQYAYNTLFGLSGYTISTTATGAATSTAAAGTTATTADAGSAGQGSASTAATSAVYTAPANLNSGAMAMAMATGGMMVVFAWALMM
ncbi:hypothetical protein HDU82_000443 [Entophlyctis luteolus]|nr:hypothetical protein HDU82_000443 [Entophlyctis luteolus]